MNGRDMMPACARIAAVDPAMADRMWNTTTDDDGRDLVDERMRGKGRVLCAACPMRLDCISRALVNGWKDKAVYSQFFDSTQYGVCAASAKSWMKRQMFHQVSCNILNT